MNYKISSSQTIAWAQRLSMLLKSGISLNEAIHLMQESTSNPKLREMNRFLEHSVAQGTLLSSALEMRRMPEILVHLVRIGESSGSLSETLEQASIYFQTREETKQRIVGAAMYPALIGFATFGVAGFLVVFIFPKIMPLFTSMHIKLPLLTRLLLVSSSFMIHYWLWIIVISVGCLAASIFLFRKVPMVRIVVQSMLLRLPLIGSLIRDQICAHLFQLTAMQLRSGCSLPKSLVEISRSVGNIHYEKALISVAEGVSSGKLCSALLKEHPLLFSSEITGLLSIAERTGELAAACEFVGSNCRKNIERAISTVTRLIEPILMLGMGLIVGSIALAIIMPIYEITNQINAH